MATLVLCAAMAHAQTIGTGHTVRKHRVAEEGSAADLSQAEACIDRKDYPAAEQLLTEAVKKNPKDYRAWYYLGYVYSSQHRVPEAIDAYRKSVELNSSAFEPTLNLGLVLAESGSAEAEKYLRIASNLKPTIHPAESLAAAHLALGRVLQKSDPKQALEEYARVAELQPKNPEPHMLAGSAAETLHDNSTAEREYQAASQLDPKSIDALTALANLYLDGGGTPQPAKAEATLRKLVDLEPQNAKARLQLARLLAESSPEEAAAQLEAAQKLSPNDPEIARNVAFLYKTGKQYAKAEAQLRPLVQKNPKDAELRYQLGDTLLKQKKYPEAERELNAALNLQPNLVGAYEGLAIAASENKDYAAAIAALEGRSRLVPENPATYFLRATSYDNLGDYKRAAEYYHHFLEVSNGKFPDQEWQAKHRLIAIEPKKH